MNILFSSVIMNTEESINSIYFILLIIIKTNLSSVIWSVIMNPYQEWLGRYDISGMTKPNFYELLGLQFGENNIYTIEQAANEMATRLNSVNPGPNIGIWNSLMSDIANARTCLCNPASRMEYDNSLQGGRFGGGYSAGSAFGGNMGYSQAPVNAPQPGGFGGGYSSPSSGGFGGGYSAGAAFGAPPAAPTYSAPPVPGMSAPVPPVPGYGSTYAAPPVPSAPVTPAPRPATPIATPVATAAVATAAVATAAAVSKPAAPPAPKGPATVNFDSGNSKKKKARRAAAAGVPPYMYGVYTALGIGGLLLLVWLVSLAQDASDKSKDGSGKIIVIDNTPLNTKPLPRQVDNEAYTGPKIKPVVVPSKNAGKRRPVNNGGVRTVPIVADNVVEGDVDVVNTDMPAVGSSHVGDIDDGSVVVVHDDADTRGEAIEHTIGFNPEGDTEEETHVLALDLPGEDNVVVEHGGGNVVVHEGGGRVHRGGNTVVVEDDLGSGEVVEEGGAPVRDMSIEDNSGASPSEEQLADDIGGGLVVEPGSNQNNKSGKKKSQPAVEEAEEQFPSWEDSQLEEPKAEEPAAVEEPKTEEPAAVEEPKMEEPAAKPTAKKNPKTDKTKKPKAEPAAEEKPAAQEESASEESADAKKPAPNDSKKPAVKEESAGKPETPQEEPASAPESKPAPIVKVAIPKESEQMAAESKFKADNADVFKSKDTAPKSQLAEKLIEDSSAMESPAEKYAALSCAVSLATDSKQASAALKAIETKAKYFEDIDAYQEGVDVLLSCKPTDWPADQKKVVADAAAKWQKVAKKNGKNREAKKLQDIINANK